jgi:hypothetical protein
MNQLPLRDIHLPEAVSWWPPAIGWWLLPLLIIAVYFFMRWLIKRIRYQPMNKRVQIEFERIQQAYKQHQDQQQLVADISVFLRRSCISYKNRISSASLTGEAWLHMMNSISTVKLPDGIAQALLSAPYRRQVEINTDELLAACSEWIKGLPKHPQEQAQ